MPAKRDLDPGASPLHFFGAEVRRGREAAGMTLADLGAAVPCDASTVSKIEAGILNPTERFLAACTEAFPGSDWLARFYHDSRTWGDGPYPRWFEDWLNHEREASSLRIWQPLIVPGLLQTADYPAGSSSLASRRRHTGSPDQGEDPVGDLGGQRDQGGGADHALGGDDRVEHALQVGVGAGHHPAEHVARRR